MAGMFIFIHILKYCSY